MAVINVNTDETAIHINVSDNGKGFDKAREQIDGIGLKTIRDKVSLLSGTINILSENGTTIIITLPRRVD